MVFGPLGYWGMISVGGIILQLVGFIWLLPEFRKKIKDLGRKIGDSHEEINAADKLVNLSGIYFIILGTIMQLISTILNAYFPNFLSNSSWPF